MTAVLELGGNCCPNCNCNDPPNKELLLLHKLESYYLAGGTIGSLDISFNYRHLG